MMNEDPVVVAAEAAMCSVLPEPVDCATVTKIISAIEPLIRVRVAADLRTELIQRVMELGSAVEDGALVPYHAVLKIIEGVR